ncbi:MAG TPA: HU family DNA-binding protein [Chitinophagales bacterium]|nr:HU family DNA-binding protein [Chitinophagales bacterium]HRK27923.1 HU family DNA-binding protein [Chitinophagales bacterium]
MNKKELIDHIASEAGLTKLQAAAALTALVKGVESTLKAGDKVVLVGFGTFSTGERSARTARNPQTGATVEVPARKVVKFKSGKDLENAVN